MRLALNALNDISASGLNFFRQSCYTYSLPRSICLSRKVIHFPVLIILIQQGTRLILLSSKHRSAFTQNNKPRDVKHHTTQTF